MSGREFRFSQSEYANITKCNMQAPACAHCVRRNEVCEYPVLDWARAPIDSINTTSNDSGMGTPRRVEHVTPDPDPRTG